MKTAQEQFIEYVEARLREQEEIYVKAMRCSPDTLAVWNKITKPGDYSVELDFGLSKEFYYRPVTEAMKLVEVLGYTCSLTHSSNFKNERLIIKVDDAWISNLVKYHALKSVALHSATC